MSETEKPAEVQVARAANGTGPPVKTEGGAVAEKTDEKENGIKIAAEEGNGAGVKKAEDVKMVDAVDVKAGERNEEGGGGEEVEPMKVEGEEKGTVEPKDEQEAEEKIEVVKEKHKEAGEETVGAEEKSTRTKVKSVVGNEKNGESEEEGEEAEEKGDESEEKGEEAEEKGDGAGEKSEESNQDNTEENEEEKGTRKKRRRGRKPGQKVGRKEKKESVKTKGVLRTPPKSSVDRPVRERKTVERLVEIVEKEPAKNFLVEKGRGTPLKDIPNVAYKLSKKKAADIKSLHLLLFGRKGKAINFKSHIFQFSGFVWRENEDKQRTKVKEKLDKCVKHKLLDLCDVFDIPVSKTASRKEELVAKLLNFMVTPHATTDVILAEREQSAKTRKRKRVSRSALRRSVGISGRQSRKKRIKSGNTSKSEKSTIEMEDEDEDDEDGDGGEEDKENGLPDEDEAIEHSESEEGEESEHDNSEKESAYPGKDRQDAKKLSKKRASPSTAKSKKVSTRKKIPQPASTKSPNKPYSKRLKAEAKDSNEEVFSRKKKNVVTPKKMSSSNSDMQEKKTTGNKAGRSKAKSDRAEVSGPTEEDLRERICEILKEVDFNTATFTDILKKLASHYNMDLTARKASIKLMIQDELTKLADEAEDEDDSEDEGDAEKNENSKSEGKEVEA